MKILEWIEEEAGALVVATIAAVLSALGTLLLAIFVGAKFVKSELGAWFGVMPGFPAALIVGIVVFVIVFLRVRSC
jgi:Na+/glutamate symporter